MILRVFRRHAYFLSFTLSGFVALFVVGLLSSLFASEAQLAQLLDGRSLGWWRIASYVMLLMMWPRFVTRVIGDRQLKSDFYKSRKPLLVVVLLYELLIVLNPLAYVVRWVI